MKTDIALQSLNVSMVGWNTDFEAHLVKKFRNLKTRSSASQHVRVFSLWYESRFHQAFEPSLLTNYDCLLYREHSLKQAKVAANTWNARLWALTILCNWIGDLSLLDGVEFQNVMEGSEKHRALTDDEYHRLIHTCEQNIKRALTETEYRLTVRDYAMTMLMLHGLRVDEAAHVESGDITLNDRSGMVLVRNGKGSKERKVPLNLIGRKALASYLDLGFATVSDRTLQRDVSALGSQIGVPDLTPHWLRYTFAKRLEKNATTLEEIRRLLGHRTIEQTRRYLRSSLEELQSAVEGVM